MARIGLGRIETKTEHNTDYGACLEMHLGSRENVSRWTILVYKEEVISMRVVLLLQWGKWTLYIIDTVSQDLVFISNTTTNSC